MRVKPYKQQPEAPKATGTGVIVHPDYSYPVKSKSPNEALKREFRDQAQHTKIVPSNKIETVPGNSIDPELARAQQKVNNQKLKDWHRNQVHKESATKNVPTISNVPKVEQVALDTADTRSWIRKHPYKTAAIAGAGVGAAGTGAYLYNKNRQNNG